MTIEHRPVTTLCYPDGRVVRPGDRVRADEGPAVVEDVIDTEASFREWGVGEPGLMLRTERFGLVFEPLPLRVELVARAARVGARRPGGDDRAPSRRSS